jgi:hypothetical protein
MKKVKKVKTVKSKASDHVKYEPPKVIKYPPLEIVAGSGGNGYSSYTYYYYYYTYYYH